MKRRHRLRRLALLFVLRSFVVLAAVVVYVMAIWLYQ
jgi:hypothetical protein